MTDWMRIGSDWLQLGVAGACGGVLALWAALGRRDRALTLRQDRVVLDVHTLEQRMTRLEATGATPAQCAAHVARIVALEEARRLGVTHEDMKHAHMRMDAFEAKIGHMTGLLEGIGIAVNRIHQHLLEYGPRAGDRP